MTKIRNKNQIQLYWIGLLFLSAFFVKIDKASAVTCASSFGTCKLSCDLATEGDIGNLDCTMGKSCCTTTASVTAATCATENPGFSCVDSTGKTGCVQFLCLGGNNIQCCPPTTTTPSGSSGTCDSLSGGGACVPTSTACLTGETVNTTATCAAGQHCCAPTASGGGGGSGAVTCFHLGGSCTSSLPCASSDIENATATCPSADIPYCCVPKNSGAGGGGTGTGTNPTGTGAALDCGANFEKIGGVCYPANTGLSDASITTILSNLFSWLMGIFTTLAVLAFVLSGIQYLTSAGNEEMMETAKRNAIFSILGIVVGLSGFVIVKAIAAALSGTGTTF